MLISLKSTTFALMYNEIRHGRSFCLQAAMIFIKFKEDERKDFSVRDFIVPMKLSPNDADTMVVRLQAWFKWMKKEGLITSKENIEYTSTGSPYVRQLYSFTDKTLINV